MTSLKVLQDIYAETQVEGWDGYGAETVKSTTYMNTRKFISLLPLNIRSPDISPEPDGEIALDWYGKGKDIFSVSRGSEGQLSYVCFHGESRTNGVEHLTDIIPQQVLDYIEIFNRVR